MNEKCGPIRIKDKKALNRARKLIDRWSNSCSRMGMVWQYRELLEQSDWYVLLGEYWSSCDNIWHCYRRLEKKLPKRTIPELMTRKERERLASFEGDLTVYRGCGELNTDGASWSLNRETANSFPHLRRYLAERPIIVTAVVPRSEVLALKDGRHEDEIITFSPKVISIEESIRPPEEWWVERHRSQESRLDKLIVSASLPLVRSTAG